MKDDVRELYQEMIVDHGKRPRNFRELSDASAEADGYNPLCGDRVHVFLRVDGDRIADITFQGSGCAISTASASLMTESLRGRTRSEVMELIRNFHNFVTAPEEADFDEAALGKLRVLAGVRDYPTRVKCAVLAWHALRAALSGGGNQSVSTE